LLGNATRDTELRTTKSGKPVANMRLATNRLVKNADGSKDELTEYHTVICWGRLAETSAEYVVKGKPVYVEGRLSTRTYKDDEGHEHERTEVIGVPIATGQKTTLSDPASGHQRSQHWPAREWAGRISPSTGTGSATRLRCMSGSCYRKHLGALRQGTAAC
jgi:single stranded DNA-binding protein